MHPRAVPKPSRFELPSVTPPGDIEERHEHALPPQHDSPREGALSPPDETGFAPGVPEPVKSRLLQLMGKPAQTPEEIKHDQYLAKRRDQWRRRKERKEQEALEHDAD